MVQMHFETFSHSKPSITLRDLPKHVPDDIRFKLVTALETNANHLILHILSITDPQSLQISIRHFIY